MTNDLHFLTKRTKHIDDEAYICEVESIIQCSNFNWLATKGKKLSMSAQTMSYVAMHVINLPVKMAAINSNYNPSRWHQFVLKLEGPNILWVDFVHILSKTTHLLQKTWKLIPKASTSYILWLHYSCLSPESFNRSAILIVLYIFFHLNNVG